MPHIFISYAKKDTRDLAIQLQERLNAIDGVTAWVDRSLRAGRSWARQIQTEINRCDVMIVLVSPDVNREQPESYVLREIDYARQLSKQIIPVLAQQTLLPIELVREHYIDFTIPNLAFDDLLSSLMDELEIMILPDTVEEDDSSDNVFNNIFNRTIVDADKKDPNTLSYDEQVEIARNFNGTKNSDWTPIFRTFNVKGIDFEMCLVPVGSFIMGEGYEAHKQNINEPYWVGVHPVTNYQWRQAVLASNGAIAEPKWTNWYNDISKSKHPVVGVTWYQCRDFTKWMDETWQVTTEKEWEYAARGIDNLLYPFGNEFNASLVIFEDNSMGSTSQVGLRQQGASWVGAHDMVGNVWEWQQSIFKSYPYVMNDGRETTDSRNSRVVRGGSWRYPQNFMHTTARYMHNSVKSDMNYGFRLSCNI